MGRDEAGGSFFQLLLSFGLGGDGSRTFSDSEQVILIHLVCTDD